MKQSARLAYEKSNQKSFEFLPFFLLSLSIELFNGNEILLNNQLDIRKLLSSETKHGHFI